MLDTAIATAPTILLLEKNSDLRDVLVDSLNTVGYQVVDAKDGYDAVKTIDFQPVNLVLMAVYAPIASGVSMITAVKNFTDAPCVLMITDERLRTGKVFCHLNVATYLLKPFGIQELTETISSVLHSKHCRMSREWVASNF